MVADNGKARLWFRYWLRKKYQVDYLKLPFDAGLSKSRNEAVKKLREKYIVICEDDFIFTDKTRLENFKKILETDSQAGLAAGTLFYQGKNRIFAHRLVTSKDRYVIERIENPDWYSIDGIEYHYCDYPFNFFMMRNVPKDFYWDEDYKISKEHIDFFLRLKREGKWKIAFTPSVIVNHEHDHRSKRYQKYRMRLDSFELFFKKTGYSVGTSNVELVVWDYVEKKIMPYPEYVWKRMVEDKYKKTN